MYTKRKGGFWEDPDELTHSIPPQENKLICDDLNGHLGEINLNLAHSSAHGGFGFENLNKEGFNILEFAILES